MKDRLFAPGTPPGSQSHPLCTPKGSQINPKACKKQRKTLTSLAPKKTRKMSPGWEPKCNQNGALALPKSSVGDCKVIPGRRGHPNGAVKSPRARFGYPRAPFWLTFRARKRTQPCIDTLLKPTTSPTLSSVFQSVFVFIVR